MLQFYLLQEMKLKASTLLVFCIITLAAIAHPFYVSISTVEYNASNKQIEVSCRIFYNDLEVALQNQVKQKIDVINPKNRTVADSAIASYVRTNFRIQVNGVIKPLKFVGYEIEDDVAWCYLESLQLQPVKSIKIINQLLYQDFKTQSNIMHVTINGKRQSIKLDNPKRTAEFSF